jgi:quercetin dioxygenase-like cupin family protein
MALCARDERGGQLADVPAAAAITDRRPDWLFGSLFLGGFECGNQVTAAGDRLDVIAATQHDRFAAEDYRRCRAAGIRGVREAARWPFAERGGRLDLDHVRRLARLGREQGLTTVWDLFHYGYPDDLDGSRDDFPDRFIERFAAFATAVAEVVRSEAGEGAWYTPVNEISYTAWAVGERIMAPFWPGRSWEYKILLVRAAIAAFDAIRLVDPAARVLTAEPLVRLHVHPAVSDPEERTALQADADDFNERVVSETYDMLCGRVAPELGGSRDHLGVVGVNYYEGNQWTIATPEVPQHFLGREDPAWLPVSRLLRQLSDRYGGPIVISETGSTAELRPGWLRHLTDEAAAAIELGVDLQGICLYPIVTSPDWNDPASFFDGGLWDVEPQADGTLRRVLAGDVAAALLEAQIRLDPPSAGDGRDPLLAAAPAGPVDAPAAHADPRLASLGDLARFSADGFVCVPVFAGDALVGDLYCFEPGRSLPGHRHADTEHVLTGIRGVGDVRVGSRWVELRERESVLVPAGSYHGIHNASTERLVVQQVSSPKPWDARYGGPRPSDHVAAATDGR